MLYKKTVVCVFRTYVPWKLLWHSKKAGVSKCYNRNQGIAWALSYSINLLTLAPEVVEVVAHSDADTSTELRKADAAIEIYLYKYKHYKAIMLTLC